VIDSALNKLLFTSHVCVFLICDNVIDLHSIWTLGHS